MDHGRSINGTDDPPSTVSAARAPQRTPPPEPRRVLLMGMMGTGKTTIGHRLAELTGWPYEDNDDLVRSVAGLGPDRLLAERGVAALRDAESRALGIALRTPPPLVASVAAGVVTAAEDRTRLRDGGFVVWLQAPLELLAERVAEGPTRPWLGDHPLEALTKLYEGREPLYAEVATVAVDVADRTPDAIAGEILEAMGGRSAGRSSTLSS
ncbi:MAG: serine transporter [Streptosporangiales bacterium]|nr:serine transporter [Streptosporangiales bacterium]